MSLKYYEKKYIETGYIIIFLNPAYVTNECKLYYKNVCISYVHLKHTTLFEYHFAFYVLHISRLAKENNDFYNVRNQYNSNLN